LGRNISNSTRQILTKFSQLEEDMTAYKLVKNEENLTSGIREICV